MNVLNFRFRNWRLDIIWAIAAFGISSSLFPLCGIYNNYLKRAHDQGPFKLLFWLLETTGALFCQIFLSGRVSLFVTLAVSWALFALTDTKPKPKVRILLGLGHASAHIAVSLFCLILIQCLVEWLVADGIVTVASSSASKTATVAIDRIHGEGTTDLASCLYDEFNDHWSQVLVNFTGNLTQSQSKTMMNSTSDLFAMAGLDQVNAVRRIQSYAYKAGKSTLNWLLNMSLLSSTLYIFDLPGLIASKHYMMCEILCAGGAECMISSDPTKFLLIDRMTLTVYLMGAFLYFAVMAVPIAGYVFGTWLALMLNVFKTQYNEGFSSLRIPHWKNFLKIHIDDNGELEVYAIGLHRVPQRWMRDPEWCGEKSSLAGTPSWSVDKPSKWIPTHGESKKFTPQVIDYVRIQKRSVGRHMFGGGVSTPRDSSRKHMPPIRRTSSF